jgi:hypothetical protein
MPARNGAESNHAYKRADIASLPETLRALGYETAAFGKVAHGDADVARHGFDVHDRSGSAATVSGCSPAGMRASAGANQARLCTRCATTCRCSSTTPRLGPA